VHLCVALAADKAGRRLLLASASATSLLLRGAALILSALSARRCVAAAAQRALGSLIILSDYVSFDTSLQILIVVELAPLSCRPVGVAAFQALTRVFTAATVLAPWPTLLGGWSSSDMTVATALALLQLAIVSTLVPEMTGLDIETSSSAATWRQRGVWRLYLDWLDRRGVGACGGAGSTARDRVGGGGGHIGHGGGRIGHGGGGGDG
jgi:hypothetical protein